MEPADRIVAYFEACSTGSAADIAAHFTPEAVIFDTNIRAVRGAADIGAMWTKVRRRWGGAVWTVDSVVADAEDGAAAIEWTMTGTDPESGRSFAFRGSEHYRLADTLIDEIRQYWTFDPATLDTGLLDYPYGEALGTGVESQPDDEGA